MKIYELFSIFVKKLLQNQTLTKNSVFKFSIKKVYQILNTASFVQYNRLMLYRSMSVLNYVPRVPSCPTCLLDLRASRVHVLYVPSCLCSLCVFFFYVPSFFYVYCVPSFFIALRVFSFYVLYVPSSFYMPYVLLHFNCFQCLSVYVPSLFYKMWNHPEPIAASRNKQKRGRLSKK